MTIPAAETVGRILRSAAETEIMPRFRKLATGDVREKGPGDLVTVADEAAERYITAQLSGLIEGASIVGEEAVAADPAVLDRLSDRGAVWIIDPIDGTANFVAGRPRFGVMVALVLNGTTEAGWIFDPNSDRLTYAMRGQGAWRDGERIRVSDSGQAVGRMSGRLSKGALRQLGQPDPMKALNRIGETIDANSAAIEYADMAAGAIDFALYRNVKPWDHAPGALIVSEAGGHVSLLDATPYRPGPVPSNLGILSATDEQSWLDIRAALFEA